jgi:hypothetical protein
VADGYNVTKGDPSIRQRSLDDQRESLVRRLAVSGADLQLRFTLGETADEAIVRLARGSSEGMRW